MKTLVILKKCNAIISDNRKRILITRNQRHRDLDGRSLGICSFFFFKKIFVLKYATFVSKLVDMDFIFGRKALVFHSVHFRFKSLLSFFLKEKLR